MSVEEVQLLTEMMNNCTKQEFYSDPNANKKFNLLRKLEFLSLSYLLYLDTELEIVKTKISNCSDESIKSYLLDHQATLEEIKRRIEMGDFL